MSQPDSVPARQLDAIHAMLSAGHRNLRVERHTLVLWGLTGGVLWALSDAILTPEQIPEPTRRAVAWLVLLSLTLGLTGWADWWLTRRAKRERDEVWSFIHRQVLKVLWLMMALGVLITFAMFFFGGGYMLPAIWLTLIGLSLFIHGLFSEELLEWAGALIILTGIASLGLRLPWETSKWICAAIFGLGLPALGLMLDGGLRRARSLRALQATLWLAGVLVLPLAYHRHAAAMLLPEGPVISLEEYRARPHPPGAAIVRLPAGAEVPVEVEVSGDLFRQEPTRFSLHLAEPLEVLLQDGQLTGDARQPGGPWLLAREARWISIPWLKGELSPEAGARARASVVVNFGRKHGR